MGIKEINGAVQKVLLDKEYKWSKGNAPLPSRWVEAEYLVIEGKNVFWSIDCDKNNYREITFRELCELPPVHDELEELADELIHRIKAYQKEYNISDGDLCEVRKKVEKKLGL